MHDLHGSYILFHKRKALEIQGKVDEKTKKLIFKVTISCTYSTYSWPHITQHFNNWGQIEHNYVESTNKKNILCSLYYSN